ncbi:P-loop containing nucleoside triphosphate hydrolase protein [Flagelloscypha sp. PMI_526]|nr:P-loop containing nucleoside triphosphate hydrolase protein [Flagelloscypha sp. PMI_526]
MLWEIVGESAAGKSQLALQLCLSVQLPRQSGGLFGSACFLTTSASLPTTRLHEIIADRPIFQTQGCSLDNIHTMEAPTVSILLHILHHILPQFIQSVASSRPVKLLVIDSIAELFHLDEKTSTKSLVDRAKELTSITTTLHALLNEHKIAVVVINEVVDVFAHTSNNDGSANPNSQLLYSEHSHLFNRPYAVPGGSSKEASLGLVWANQINARIFLSRTRRRIRISEISSSKRAKIGETYLKPQSLNDEEDVLLRRLNVVFSSVGPPAALDYIITAGGFVVQQVVEQTLSQSYRPSELSLTPSPLVSSPEDPGMVTQFGGEPSLDKSRNILESEQVFPTASQISPLDLGEAVVNEADDEVVPSSQDEESIL